VSLSGPRNEVRKPLYWRLWVTLDHMPRSRPPLALFLIPAMALVAILPLILRGCSCGHDFDFHILSWFEAAAQFRAGNFHPQWAFSPAFNAGEPRFVFYPPLSWTIGAILGLAMQGLAMQGLAIPWAVVPIVFTWIALTASGATMYRLARQFCGQTAALLSAAIYIANPYMLFTAYERTAYAELLAAAWLPLLVAAALRERVSILRIAIPVVLLWLTNAPAAVMGCYALAVIALVRLIQTWFAARRDSPIAAFKAYATLTLRFTAGTALGLALAAFYILPAAYERRWVQIDMATISGMRIADNFLFHHTADPLHDAVLHTASVSAIIVLIAAAAALIAAFLRSRTRCSTLTRLTVLAFAIAFMLTPLSAPIWRIAPEMAFLQFPWRLLAVLAPAICLAVAIAIDRPASQNPSAPSMRSRIAYGWGLSLITCAIVAAITLPVVSIFRQPCDDEDTVAARLALFNSKSGTDPTDEYTPTDADNDSLAQTDPAFWLAEDPDSKPPASATPGPVPMHFAVLSPRDETLILNLRDYPAWQVKIDGVATHPEQKRADGLIALPVPSGTLHIDIAYVNGLDHTLGDDISLAALASTMALVVIKPRRFAFHRKP
jgi:hypothetical protein